MASEGQECIVYCRSWCGDCRRAFSWLDANGYSYEAIDIEEVPSAADRVIEIAGKIVTPTFQIGEISIVGFDPEAVRGALDQG